MRGALRLLVFSLLFAASPGLATGGFQCTTLGAAPISIGIVTGHGVAPVIAQARLTDGGRSWSTADAQPAIAIAQGWIDAREIKLDLVDANAERYEARVRLRPTGRHSASGTLLRHGKTYRLRCSGEQ